MKNKPDNSNEAVKKIEEEFMDYQSPAKPKYTLTTTMDDGETSSTSTITTSEPDALVQILKSAGVSDIQPEMGHDDHEMDHEMDYDDNDEMVDTEIGGCDVCGDDHDENNHAGNEYDEESIEDDVDMDVEIAPETPTSKRTNSHDDMMYMLNIMDGTNEEEVEEDWDNEPDEHHLSHDAGSMERNVSTIKRGVAGMGDNKLAAGYEIESTEAYTELSKRLSEEWHSSFKLHEVELTDKQKKYFGSKEERGGSSDDEDDDKDDKVDETKKKE